MTLQTVVLSGRLTLPPTVRGLKKWRIRSTKLSAHDKCRKGKLHFKLTTAPRISPNRCYLLCLSLLVGLSVGLRGLLVGHLVVLSYCRMKH